MLPAGHILEWTEKIIEWASPITERLSEKVPKYPAAALDGTFGADIDDTWTGRFGQLGKIGRDQRHIAGTGKRHLLAASEKKCNAKEKNGCIP
jgi:hypothetical protein